jgi:dephospho-CoA kinase
MKRKRIEAIATVGPIGSGKDTVIEYVSKSYGIPMISIGSIVADVARHEGIEPTRNNLHIITERFIRLHGPRFFSKEVFRRASICNGRYLAIAGLRYPRDVAVLKRLFRKLTVVYVRTSKPEVRFERLKRRMEPRDPKTFQEFAAQDEKEIKMFDLEKTLQMSDFVVENDGTLEELYQKIDALICRVFCDVSTIKDTHIHGIRKP